MNDFEIAEGDTLVLEEWDPETKTYTGRSIEKRVTCVSKIDTNTIEQFWPMDDVMQKGFQMISME